MKYKALKHVKFDRPYTKGEEIAEGAIDSRRVRELISWGLIAPVDGNEEVPAKEEETEVAEPVAEPEEPKVEETESVKYSRSALERMNKEELVKIAVGMEIPADDTMTKAFIINAIEAYQDAE